MTADTTSGDTIIELKRVCRRVVSPERWLLREVSLGLSKRQRVVIAGPSGSGKSVLLRAIGMLDGIDSGEILWRGSAIHGGGVPKFRSQVVYLHQNPALFKGSVQSNLEMPFQLKEHRNLQMNPSRVATGLAAVGRDEAFLGQSVRNLSGGERQVVALIRALQLDPQVLLLDEPTAAADTVMTEAIERLILQWADEQKDRAFIWVTHDDSQTERVASRRLRMDRGQLLES